MKDFQVHLERLRKDCKLRENSRFFELHALALEVERAMAASNDEATGITSGTRH